VHMMLAGLLIISRNEFLFSESLPEMKLVSQKSKDLDKTHDFGRSILEAGA